MIFIDIPSLIALKIIDAKMNIIKTAAKLIQSDVKSMDIPNDAYPSTEDIADREHAIQYMPTTLKVLLRSMFVGKGVDVKLASIGQSIMQAIRPRAILAPLQLGLGVQMHHHFSSRFLIDTLYEHGFSCSYYEVKKYERNAAVAQGTEIPGYNQEHYVQYVADNVDHNVATLDGTGTFHGMGIIAVVTPQIQARKIVPKVPVNAKDIAAVGRINIEFFKIPPKIPPLSYLQLPCIQVEDPTSQLDVLWKSSLLLRSPRPSWSGTMQMLHHGNYPGQASVVFLPMIDLAPSDPSCIFSTLKFVTSQALEYDVTPVLTFDQPLYWKALTIIRSQPVDSNLKHIVLRLGGFHMEMSFLGSIGHLMAGSGLQELLETVYASNTVSHMMTGKAVSRAVRGHMLVDAALNTIILANEYNVPLPTKVSTGESIEESVNVDPNGTNEIEQDSPITELTAAREVYDKAMGSTLPLEEVCTSEVIKRIQIRLKERKESMTSRTARLWVQYMNMVDILRQFLKAERTGNWMLHLQSVKDMLPYFAASGHSLYAKSAYIYVQSMCHLPETHPDVHQRFLDG